MGLIGAILLGAVPLLASFALVYQLRDLIARPGGTMGAEMTAGVIWMLAALLGGIGSFVLFDGLAAALTVVGVLALSYLVRTGLPKILLRRHPRH